MRGITLFSKNTGVEVKANDVVKKGLKFGVVTLRFFKLENGGSQMRFIMSPVESYAASLMITKVSGSKEALKLKKTHKFEKDGKEVETSLTLEKWVKESKSGYAVSIKRDSESINVPLTLSDFAYLGELLKYLSTQQAWVNPVETTDSKGASEEVSTEKAPADEEAPADLDIFDDCNATVSEPTAPESAPTPVAGSDLTISGKLEAVRNDGKGFKLDGKWYSVNDRTKVTGVLEKGVFVTATYRNGNSGGKFANVITCM